MRNLQIVFFFLLVLFSNNCFAQKDTIANNHLSGNIVSAVLSGELGFYYEHSISKTCSFRISYGHRFWQGSIIKNGDVGGDYKYLPQEADVARLGIKKYLGANEKWKGKNSYIVFQTSYWHMQSPKYTTTNGSNGSNTSKREVVSVERKMLNGSVGFGSMHYYNKHFFSDTFIQFGVSKGHKFTQYYSYGWAEHEDAFLYPPKTIEKEDTFLPTIDIGFCLGYCW